MRSAWREAQVVGTGQVVSKLRPCPGLPIEAPGSGVGSTPFTDPSQAWLVGAWGNSIF